MAKNGKKLVKTKLKNLPVLNQENEVIRFSLSFQYFEQHEFFGLKNEENPWFVGLIYRLKEFCEKSNDFFKDTKEKKSHRFHPIDWNAKNIPIKKGNLNWIPECYLHNDDEFPFYQFTISKAKGRFVGFFNETSTVFFIVLLDPQHNLQPSKKTNYIITPTQKSSSDYDLLLCEIDSIKKIAINCGVKDCAINNIVDLNKSRYSLHVILDTDFYNAYTTISNNYSIDDIFQTGIMELMH